MRVKQNAEISDTFKKKSYLTTLPDDHKFKIKFPIGNLASAASF